MPFSPGTPLTHCAPCFTEWVLEQKADNEEQRRIAEIDWDLRLKLQGKEEVGLHEVQFALRVLY